MSRFSLFRRHKQEMPDSDSPRADSGKKKQGKPSGADDPVLPEKKRARRRLVGAVTITLAVIIVLPMIFDSEPQTVSQDMLINIPSRDKPSQTVSREPVKKKGVENQTVVASADKPSDEHARAPADKKDTAKPVEESTAKESGKADNVKDKSGVTDSKPDVKSTTKSDAKPETKTDAKTNAAKKQDDPIGQLITQNANVSANEQEKFVIQVAAVSTQEKARELQDKLQKAGLSSYTQKVALKDGGERIRIRIGPLSSKKEVNSTCAKLSQLKLSCTLIN